MKLSLHRTGTFKVNDTAEDSTQCGFRRGDRQLWFDVTIDSSTEWLDENGFVLDNNAVQHYFDEKYSKVEIFVSCERIACEAIEDLRELVGGRCTRIVCEIKPGDYAGLRAEWHRDACDTAAMIARAQRALAGK